MVVIPSVHARRSPAFRVVEVQSRRGQHVVGGELAVVVDVLPLDAFGNVFVEFDSHGDILSHDGAAAYADHSPTAESRQEREKVVTNRDHLAQLKCSRTQAPVCLHGAHDTTIRQVVAAIRELMQPPPASPKRGRIGFGRENEE